MKVSTLGLDLAKNVFQVHVVEDKGKVTVDRQLRRQQMFSFFSDPPPCIIGLEACGAAHYWAREPQARRQNVRIISPSYAKPYVRRGKNDAAKAYCPLENTVCYSNRLLATYTALLSL